MNDYDRNHPKSRPASAFRNTRRSRTQYNGQSQTGPDFGNENGYQASPPQRRMQSEPPRHNQNQGGYQARGNTPVQGRTNVPPAMPMPPEDFVYEGYTTEQGQPEVYLHPDEIGEEAYPAVDEFYDGYEYDQPVTIIQVVPERPGMPHVLMIAATVMLVLGLLGWWGFSDRMRDLGSFVASGGVTTQSLDQNFDGETQYLYQGREVQEVTAAGDISPFFAPSVQYWREDILVWAERHNLDPNMVATIMQIESCGDPQAVSGVGATGLFQVMPFHFQPGEDAFNPETNALRGMNYFAERLVQTGGDVGRAFAGYNGGHVAAGTDYSNWVDETQRYYRWSTGIYGDAVAGNSTSETLNAWYAAGGSSLCAQAEQRLGIN